MRETLAVWEFDKVVASGLAARVALDQLEPPDVEVVLLTSRGDGRRGAPRALRKPASVDPGLAERFHALLRVPGRHGLSLLVGISSQTRPSSSRPAAFFPSRYITASAVALSSSWPFHDVAVEQNAPSVATTPPRRAVDRWTLALRTPLSPLLEEEGTLAARH